MFIIVLLDLMVFMVRGIDDNIYIDVPMNCDHGADVAAVPFTVDENGAHDGMVSVDAANFISGFERCAQEFLNDHITLDTWLSKEVIASNGEQCADAMSCTSIFNPEWRKEIDTLSKHVDILSSHYRFDKIEPQSFEVSGVRQLILETEGITSFKCDTPINNEFTAKYTFDTFGRLERIVTKTGNDLATKLQEWELHQLGKYGVAAKVNPEYNTVDDPNNNGFYKIVIDEETLFFIALIGVLLIVSVIICTVSTYKYKYDNQVVSYSKVNHLNKI